MDASDAISSYLIILSRCIIRTIVAVSIDDVDDHKIIIHLVKDGLLVIANLCVVTTASPSKNTLHTARHIIRPLHSTDETVVHSITGIRIVSTLHAHNV